MVFELCGRFPHEHGCPRSSCQRVSVLRPWLVAWCIVLGICNIVLCGYIEIVEQQACQDNEFRLTCPSLNTHVAILEAIFTPMAAIGAPADIVALPTTTTYSPYKIFGNPTLTEPASTPATTSEPVLCDAKFYQFSYPHTAAYKYNGTGRIYATNRKVERNLRAPLTHRCSGVNHCSFILSQDHQQAAAWGTGVVYMKYVCMDDSRVTKFCNQEVEVGEGFVQTPGYPHYYIGPGVCRWLLRAPRGQRVRLELLDLSFRSIGPYEEDCVDRLTIVDGSTERTLFSSCEQVLAPLTMESEGETLDVLVKVNSKDAFPKRGVLFQYKGLGCVTPAAPRDGYLVFRQPLEAQFMCCVGFSFPDSGLRSRTLACLQDNMWDAPLPDCIRQTTKIWDGNGTHVADNTPDHFANKNDNMLVDIVIPSLLIAALFVGNAVIVLIIFKYRKRKEQELEENEEFTTLTMEGPKKNGRVIHSSNDNVSSSV